MKSPNRAKIDSLEPQLSQKSTRQKAKTPSGTPSEKKIAHWKSLKGPGRPKKYKPALYTKSTQVTYIDARTREGMLMKAVREALIAHVGGAPTVPELMLIDRIVWLTLKVAMIDTRIINGTDTEYDSKTYLAWSNSLQRSLVKLGLKEPNRKANVSMADLLISRGKAQLKANRGKAA